MADEIKANPWINSRLFVFSTSIFLNLLSIDFNPQMTNNIKKVQQTARNGALDEAILCNQIKLFLKPKPAQSGEGKFLDSPITSRNTSKITSVERKNMLNRAFLLNFFELKRISGRSTTG